MRRRHPKRDGKLAPFVAISWDVLNSLAYKSLSPSAGKALPYFFGKPKAPFNDRAYLETEFTFSYGEAKSYGFARSTFHKILCETIEKGFVDPVDKGGLRGAGKTVSKFKLSKRWQDYGKTGFKRVDYKQFQPREN